MATQYLIFELLVDENTEFKIYLIVNFVFTPIQLIQNFNITGASQFG